MIDENANNESLRRLIGLLLLGMADHIQRSGATSTEDMYLEIVRNELFFRLQGHLEWYVEAYRLFFDVLPAATDAPAYFDIDDVLRSAYSLGLGDIWCLTALFGITSLRVDQPMLFASGWGSEVTIDTDVLDAWYRIWSAPLDSVCSAARVDLAEASPWAFSSLRSKPIVDLEDRGFAVRSHFLAEKAGPTGMFWLVADALPPEIPYTQWSTLFGEMILVPTTS